MDLDLRSHTSIYSPANQENNLLRCFYVFLILLKLIKIQSEIKYFMAADFITIFVYLNKMFLLQILSSTDLETPSCFWRLPQCFRRTYSLCNSGFRCLWKISLWNAPSQPLASPCLFKNFPETCSDFQFYVK